MQQPAPQCVKPEPEPGFPAPLVAFFPNGLSTHCMACAPARPRHGQCNDRKQSCQFRMAGDVGVPDVESPCFRIGEKAFNPPSLAIKTERIFRRGNICGNQQQLAIAEFLTLEAQSVFRPVVHAWKPARPLPGARLAQKRSKLKSPAMVHSPAICKAGRQNGESFQSRPARAECGLNVAARGAARKPGILRILAGWRPQFESFSLLVSSSVVYSVKLHHANRKALIIIGFNPKPLHNYNRACQAIDRK